MEQINMSLILKAKGADFSGLSLPKLIKTIGGLPADGLVGLYMLNDGVLGESVSSLIDSSGNGNDATLYGATVAPIQTATGLNVTDIYGVKFNTGIQQGAEFTVIACIKPNYTSTDATTYPTLFGDTGVISSSYGTSNPHNKRLQLNLNHNVNGAGFSTGVWDYEGIAKSGTAYSRYTNTSYASSKAVVTSLSVDNIGNVRFADYNKDIILKDISPSLVANAYVGLSVTQVIGCWAHQSSTKNPCELYGFAIYNKSLSDDELTFALAKMRGIVASKGVDI
jgi:hypothetical protein